MIYQVAIKSLPQDWLWCETWCDDESKQRAKTIDLVSARVRICIRACTECSRLSMSFYKSHGTALLMLSLQGMCKEPCSGSQATYSCADCEDRSIK